MLNVNGETPEPFFATILGGGAVPDRCDPAVSDKPPVPVASVYVTATKPEQIELVMEADSWKGKHRKAIERA